MHASLRRRLFGWFGVAIVVSGALAWGIYSLLEPAAVALPLSVVAGAAVLWMAAGGIAWAVTRPLAELVRVARAIGEGELDRRMRVPPKWTRGEVAVLSRAVNTMAERIESQIDGQRELLAGVSHELRTPLGHMRVLIDTARDGSDGDEPTTALDGPSAVFDELEREVIELDGLVDQLLAHSRLEFDRVEHLRLDPVALAVRALERVGEDASKLEVETEAETLDGDPTLLGRALANLLTNARIHGGGVERVHVYDERGRVCFEVDDRGPGFASTAGVFDSFVQGEGSARRGGSLGLGLALVRRIAEAHGGEAWAGNRDGEGGGARVGFAVPRRQA